MSKLETRSEIVIRAGTILNKVLPDGTSVYLILLGKDTYDSRGKWGFPKGRMEPKDKNDPMKTAKRETWEETGIQIADRAFDPENTFKCNYDTIILYNINLTKSAEHISMPDELHVVDPEEIVRIKWATLEDIIRIPEKDKNSPMRQWLEKISPVRKWQESPKPKSRQWKMNNESWR